MTGMFPHSTQLSNQRWADSINMWPNAVGTVNRPLPGVQVYKLFAWVFLLAMTRLPNFVDVIRVGFLKMLIFFFFFNFEILK